MVFVSLAIALWLEALWLQTPAADPLASARDSIAKGRYQEAVEQLAQAGDSAEAAHLAGVARYNLRQYGPAAESLRRAAGRETEGTPAWAESVLLLGQSYYLAARLEDAIPWLERAARAGVKQMEVSYMLGNTFVQTRQPERAMAAFAAMFGVKPGGAGAWLLTAQMMTRLEFEEDAAKALAKALELDPRIPGAHLMLGERATFRNRIDEAVEELRKELEIAPNSDRAWYKLGDACARREQWAQAIPHLQRSVWLNPNQSGPYILLGKCYFKQRDLVNAEGVLRRAIRMDPGNYSAHYLLGQTLVQQGRADEGKKLLERARELQQ